MKDLRYQQKAINRLVEHTCDLLEHDRPTRQKLILEAPTGSGKTVMMATYLERIKREIAQRKDLTCQRIAFIWLAPNQLHTQSYNSLKRHFADTRTIRPVLFEEVSNKSLQADEVLCVNWQSVSREDNLYVKENEQGKFLAEYVRNCRIDGTEVIVILDEAHLFASKGKKAIELLAKLDAKIEIDVSATPFFTNADQTVKILRGDVVREQMIKKSISLNPLLKKAEQGDKGSTSILLDLALAKLKELETAYQKEGAAIRPLLLIQMPNDGATESSYDKQVRLGVEELLEKRGITTKNEQLAIWLSNEKINLDGIEQKNAHQQVLIFKQAIALGWDCPRAAVLLIFRELKQEGFTVQTVGRIMRMPEQKHYVQEDVLNYGYVYTDLAKDMINIIKGDLGYITMEKAIRIPNYVPINLPSVYIHRSTERNRLNNPDYKNSLFEAAERKWGLDKNLNPNSLYERNRQKLKEQLVETDVDKIIIRIVSDETLTGDVQVLVVNNKADIARTKSELDNLLKKFCRQNVGSYAPVDSTPCMSFSLQQLLMTYCGYDEVSAMKIVLGDNNQGVFADLITDSLVIYEIKLKQKPSKTTQKVKNFHWDVPSERIYADLYEEIKGITTQHALTPLFVEKDRSEPERLFMLYLDKHADSIQWWYKNGDNSQGDFAIAYQDSQKETRSFYVDFIIMHKDGTIGLFDTKTSKSDREAVNKHNALVDYLDKLDKKAIGGVLIFDGFNWKYSLSKIENDTNLKSWESYVPKKHIQI
jgi:type III restriction enzyme